MKNYRKMVVSLGILYFLCVLIFVIITGRSAKENTRRADDIIKLNDIAMDAADSWNNINDLDKSKYGIEFTILDNEGKIVYTTSKGISDTERLSVETAIKKGYPYKYVSVNGHLQGYVIILHDEMSRFNSMRLRFLFGLCAVGISLITAAVLFGVYIRKRIYLPFRNMREFAGAVAEGRLDSPLEMDKDNMFGAFTESFDIMREELRESRMREAALQKREKELVASLSHDLKTPITGIKLTCELLEAKLAAGEDEPDMGEKIGNIYKKADQIDVLVSDLFSATLEDLGEFKVSCKDERADVLKDIIEKYDDKGLVISEAIPKVLVHIDIRRMSQVIGKIISNSYKYAGTVIEVRYTLVDDYLEMTLTDHGPGVPEDELPLITNKFYRGKIWEESKEEGNGLGLYISKVLMKKMDGELMLESKGDGLKIILLIPLS